MPPANVDDAFEFVTLRSVVCIPPLNEEVAVLFTFNNPPINVLDAVSNIPCVVVAIPTPSPPSTNTAPFTENEVEGWVVATPIRELVVSKESMGTPLLVPFFVEVEIENALIPTVEIVVVE